MENVLKQRLVGLCILIVFSVVFLPLVLDGAGMQQKKQTTQSNELDLPNQKDEQNTPQYTTVLNLAGDKGTKTTISASQPNTKFDLKPLPVDPLKNDVGSQAVSAHNDRSAPPSLKKKPKPLPKSETTSVAQVKPSSSTHNTVKPEPKKTKKPQKLATRKTPKKTKNKKPNLNATSNPQWMVQVGGFSKKQNALALEKKLVKQGYKVRIDHSGNIYRVRVGGYSSKAKALAAKESLSVLYQLKPILVK